MKLILVSDIFGRTPEFEELASELSSDSMTATIVDPYDGKYIEFHDENHAHACFQNAAGIERYRDMLSAVLAHADGSLFLIGFSVGASALWALSEGIRVQGIAGALCFYGAQIRNFLNVCPAIEIKLVFPDHEPHFDTSELISQLSYKKNIACCTVPYLHGFMNKRSNNFNETGYGRWMQLIKEKALACRLKEGKSP